MGEGLRANAERSRRAFLSTAAGVGLGIGAAGFTGMLGPASPVRAEAASVEAAANLAANVEKLVLTLYCAVLNGATFAISRSAADHLELAVSADLRHLDALYALGGPLTLSVHLPKRVLSDASVFVQSALRIETALTGLYLAATEKFAALGKPKLAVMAAQYAASEAQHVSWIGRVAGLSPADLALSTPLCPEMNDALTTLEPFFSGASGFEQVHEPTDQRFFGTAYAQR